MRDRRRREVVSWSNFFWFTAVVVFSCVFLTGFSFSTFHLFFGAGRTFHPVLGSTRQTPSTNAISSESPVIPVLSVRETVSLPDQTLLFLKYPPSAPLFTKDDLDCLYLSANSLEPQLKQPPAQVDGQIVRCPSPPRGLTVSIALKSNERIPPGPTHRWDSLAYEALIDRDNSTVVFVKGLNLRPARVSNSSRYECVYGWDFRRPNHLLRSEVLSVAQEIVRCRTPLSVLISQPKVNDSVKVSIRVKGRGILHSIAHPGYPLNSSPDPPTRKSHEMCICTMVRNQARFLKEWVIYHAQIGVQRWYVYDNNSDDDTSSIIETLFEANYNISRHVWPWIKTQEAGFAHCALRARDSCDWVGFIDTDEFFHLPSGLTLPDMVRNLSSSGHEISNHSIGELRVSCFSFGPSRLKKLPPQGVTVGYTCRMAAPERHKSIVRPEALNSTLINVVHHFHLKDEFQFINVDRGAMVVNHYKYQVWEVFKEKFYRRVATYVADWQEDQNVGSKDRAPGLGTRAVEPPDWSSRFCEVTDTGLRDRVLQNFADPKTHRLPWQDQVGEGQAGKSLEETKIKRNRKIRRKQRVLL